MSANQVPEVAMTIVEPGGRRWAQLLNINWKVLDLIPLIVRRLDLPQQLDYELERTLEGRTLRAQDTLLGAGVAAGEELLLRPVRNKLLADLLNALYEEAVGYVAKQLWGQAEAKLETVLRLDPFYPDAKGVKAALAARGLAPDPAGSAPVRQAPPTDPASVPSSSPPPVASSGPVTGGPSPTPTTTVKAAGKSRSGCFWVALVLGVLVLAFIVLAGGGIAWFLSNATSILPDSASTLLPGIPTSVSEPVLGTGDVQITLRWQGPADLDLHVIDPGGEEIYYLVPESSSGGRLDVDANGLCQEDPPVENVFWPTGGAPGGDYQVRVDYYGDCETAGSTSYEVTVLMDGQIIDLQSGVLASPGDSQIIGEYSR